jgi:hypothetical protein
MSDTAIWPIDVFVAGPEVFGLFALHSLGGGNNMTATMLANRSRTVQQWRNVADDANPAGPLYIAGAFAEADITNPGPVAFSGMGVSICTGSHGIDCC